MSRWNYSFRIAVAALSCSLVWTGEGHAFPSGGHKATPFNGSAFTSSCVGHNFQGFGLGGNLGTDLATRGILNAANGPANCSAATSNGVGTVNSSAADGGPIGNLGGSYSGTASGEARAGVIRLQSANTATTTQRFTGAAANGGWNDQFTVSGGSGQGLWVTDIHVSGNVNAQDPGTTAIFQILPYLNTQTISSSPAHQGAALSLYQSLNTPNNGDVISASSFQISSWGAVNHGGGDPLTQFAVNETVRLVIPVTYGLPVDVGIFASVLVGERAQSAANGFADVQFQNTVTWMGAGQVFDWDAQNGVGAENTNFTLTAASGLDYTQSFASVSEPVQVVLLCTGVLAMAGFRQMKSRRR